MTESIQADIINVKCCLHLHDGRHTNRNNHGKYCLHAFGTYMTDSIQTEIIMLIMPTYMTEGIQTEIIMLSIAYMPFRTYMTESIQTEIIMSSIFHVPFAPT